MILMPLKEHLQTPIYHAGSRKGGRFMRWNLRPELRHNGTIFQNYYRGCAACAVDERESHFGLDRDSFPCERSFVPTRARARYHGIFVRGINRIRRPPGYRAISADISFIVHAYKRHSVFIVPRRSFARGFDNFSNEKGVFYRVARLIALYEYSMDVWISDSNTAAGLIKSGWNICRHSSPVERMRGAQHRELSVCIFIY